MSNTDIIAQIQAAAAPIVADSIIRGIDGRNTYAVATKSLENAIQAVNGVASAGLHFDRFTNAAIANVELLNGECVSVELIEADPEKLVAQELIDSIGVGVMNWDNLFSVQRQIVYGIAKAIRTRDIKIADLETKLSVLECRANASESMAAHTQSVAYQALHSAR